MATSLLTLLDDVASILDDVAAMTKVATRKTAGVLGDDLALNANQVAGVRAERELPVVWAVAKGSFLNKLILVPLALLISAVAPWAITPLLMLGGVFLCFEGVEKLFGHYLHPEQSEAANAAHKQAVQDESIDLVAAEKQKIKGAIRTDLILSAEIIVISLGTVADASFGVRFGVLAAISLIMTVGVYGLVAGIVKLDDAGRYLTETASSVAQAAGRGILAFAPYLMKTLSIVGTAAMFIVGGGIITHGFHWLSEAIASTASITGRLPAVGDVVQSLTTMALDSAVGIIAGLLVLGLVHAYHKVRGGSTPAHS